MIYERVFLYKFIKIYFEIDSRTVQAYHLKKILSVLIFFQNTPLFE